MGKQRVRTLPENRPIVIMTSNSEKALPDAFLRRCVFFHIEFPGTDQLQRILSAKGSAFSPTELQKIVAHFQQVRAA